MNINQGMKVTFNGIDLSKWIEVSDVQRNIGQNRKATLIKVGTSNGKRFISTSADEGTIVVKGDVMYQLVSQRRDLAAALATDEPVQLIFDDEPDKYYMAICDQQTTMSEEQFLGEAVITFVVPDDLAYAVATSTVTGSSGTDITINNAGSAPTAPVLTATMAGDNGLVGWTNDQGAVLQFGSSDEIDGVTKQRSETVYHYTFDTEPTDVVLNNGAVAYATFNGNPATPNLQDGPFNYTRTPGTATPASVRTADMKWSGPSMSRIIGPNSAGTASGNFRFVNRVKFGTSVSSYGRTEYNLTHNGKVVISLLFYDNSSGLDQLVFEGTVGDQHLFVDSLPRNYYKDGEYDFSISKLGDQITFRLDRVNLGGGGVEMRVVDGLSDIEVDGMTCWFTGFSDTPGWTMNWEDSYFEWINVDYWNDIPNRFKAGDVVVADVGTKTVFVNGVEERTLPTVGNMWDSFKLQPGENTIHPLASTWAKPFTAKIEYREAWY